MFGHSVFDIPLKTFNASPYCKDNMSKINEVIGCPPYLGDYFDTYDINDPYNTQYTGEENYDGKMRQFNLANTQYDVKMEQALLEGMMEMAQHGEPWNDTMQSENDMFKNRELRWCHDTDKYGPYLYWWFYDTSNDSELAHGMHTVSALSDSEVSGSIGIMEQIFHVTTFNKVDCKDEGIEEKESFDYGPSGGSGDAGDSDEDEEEPEDPSSLKYYYLPIVLILAGGAAYYYKDQLIQVSKRIM